MLTNCIGKVIILTAKSTQYHKHLVCTIMKKEKVQEENCLSFDRFVFLFEIILTTSLVVLVCWQSWAVTEKFLSRPQQISVQYQKLEDLPPIEISICFVDKVTDCSLLFV